MNAEQKHAELLEVVSTPIDEPVTLAKIKSVLPTEAYAMVRLTLQQATQPIDETAAAQVAAAEMEDTLAAMRTVGVSLSEPERQAVIDQLAASGGWPDAVRDVIKSLGVRREPRWKSEGWDHEPTLGEVQP